MAPLQRFEPGVHTPAHRPFFGSQMLGHVMGAPHNPSAPQCLDDAGSVAHSSLPGTHWPAHAPVAGSQTNGHAVA